MDSLASLTVHQLRVFLALSRAATLREAADELGLTTPTVSNHLKTMEHMLGVRLLHREPGRRALRLTAQGVELARAYGEAIAALEAGFDAVLGLDRRRRQVVQVGCGSAFGSRVLPGLYRRFREVEPDMEVQLVTLHRPGLVDDLLSRKFDLLVTLEHLEDQRVSTDRLGLAIELVLVAHPTHRWAGRTRIPISELAGEPLVLPSENSVQRSLLSVRATDAGIQLRTSWEVGSQDARVQSAIAGLGVAAVAKDAAADACARGDLVILPVEGFPVRCEWYACWRSGDLHPAAHAFRRFLITESREANLPEEQANLAVT